MPDFVLNRNYALRSLSGHSINFKKGQPTHVPPACVNEAVAIGADPVEGKIDVLGPEVAEKEELNLEQRRELLFKAFATMEKREVRGDFNAQGLPHVKALDKIVGFLPDSKERNESWQAYLEAKAE